MSQKAYSFIAWNDIEARALEAFHCIYPGLYDGIIDGNVSMTIEYYTNATLQLVYPAYQYNNNDTILYVVNCSDDRGFVILSREYGIVAISKFGNLPLSAFYQPVTDEWIESSGPLYIATTLVDMFVLFAMEGKTIINPFVDQYVDIDVDEPYLSDEVGPLVSTQMHQGEPYNAECEDLLHNKLDAGCVAIAITQLCAYHQMPAMVSYLGEHIYCNWPAWIVLSNLWNSSTSSSNYGTTDFARCINLIGRKSGIQYWLGNSGTTSWLAKQCVRYLDGFENVNLEDLNTRNRTYLFNIDNKRPLICLADNANGDEGHAWLIDGYALLNQDYVSVNTTTGDTSALKTKSYIVVNCNWGWGGYLDGYYNDGSFDLASYDPDLKQRVKAVANSQPDRYCENVELITYTLSR